MTVAHATRQILSHRRLPALGIGCAATASLCIIAASDTHAKELTHLRLVQYNVLSDSLDGADHYIHCDPKDLDGEVRFKRVVAKLEEQMKGGAVLSLQEVSRNWGGKLIPIFEKHGYNYATALTGSKFGGYMGQCLAWPARKYSAQEVETIRVSDTVTGWPRHPKPTRPNFFRYLWNYFSPPGKPPFDPWKVAQDRHNGVVLVKLQDKHSGRSFAVGTYHMPCLFGSDAKCTVMSIHLQMLFQHAQNFANGIPLIVAGDFNVQPDSAQYSYITTGDMALDHPQNPKKTSPIANFSMAIQPMRSAFVAKNGKEPDYTNLAWSKFNKEKFIATLDYIWLSDEWSVNGVPSLPTEEAMTDVKSFPSPTEPSDHILVWADLSF